MPGYWLITTNYLNKKSPRTIAINIHPSIWLKNKSDKEFGGQHIECAIPMTEQHYHDYIAE